MSSLWILINIGNLSIITNYLPKFYLLSYRISKLNKTAAMQWQEIEQIVRLIASSNFNIYIFYFKGDQLEREEVPDKERPLESPRLRWRNKRDRKVKRSKYRTRRQSYAVAINVGNLYSHPRPTLGYGYSTSER